MGVYMMIVPSSEKQIKRDFHIQCREVMTVTVERNGVTYNVSEYSVDFGKAGTARVTVYDPCIDEEARQRRRERLLQKCEEQIRRGLS